MRLNRIFDLHSKTHVLPEDIEKRYAIVIADDDIDDHFLIGRAIKETNIQHTLLSVYNGLELINLLLKQEKYSASQEQVPDLVLMDLNMPLLDGFGALKQIRENAATRDIAVYVLSTSRFEYDRDKSKELGATGFFVKPYHFDGLKDIIREIFTATVRHINQKVR
jgi:CheY-like chemotaxis protein